MKQASLIGVVCALGALFQPSAMGVTIDFTTVDGDNIQVSELVFDVSIDGSGNVSATNNAGLTVPVTGSVGGGFGDSFSITFDAINGGGGNAAVRIIDNNSLSNGGLGVQGRNPGRIEWQNTEDAEIMPITVDTSGLSVGVEVTEMTFANFSGDPDPLVTAFDDTSDNFGPGAAVADLGGAAYTLAGGSSGQLELSVGTFPSGTVHGFSLQSFSFDLILPQLLDLVVDRSTGGVTLINNGSIDIQFVGLSLMSDSGSLDPSDWNSITANYDAGGGDGGDGSVDPDDSWLLLESSKQEVAEATLGTTSIAGGQSIDLGSVFELGGVEDLVGEFADPITSASLPLTISYIDSAPSDLLPGDFNEDGSVDAADYTVWRDNLGQSITLPNETVSNGRVSAEDLETWRANYGATAAAIASAVPEPVGLLLLTAAWLIPAASRRSAR